jgi:hypothetical protein
MQTKAWQPVTRQAIAQRAPARPACCLFRRDRESLSHCPAAILSRREPRHFPQIGLVYAAEQ